jgi:Isopenicillin N synthase and related dioxygenases
MIPLLDFRLQASGKDPQSFAQQMGQACRDEGVFLLSEHGIPRGLLRDVLSAAEAFFALSEAEKAPLDIRHSPINRGWAPSGVELLGGVSGTPLIKESFSLGLDLSESDPRVQAGEPFRGPNLWPEDDMFRDVMRDYYKEMLGLGRALMRGVERDLELPQGFFQPHFTDPMATLRLSYYPVGSRVMTPPSDQPQFDYGGLTLVLTDGSGGVQIRSRTGQWRDVPEIPGALLVLVGDGLMRWTNDQYRSVPHRLLPPTRPRTLAAFYLDPNPDSIIAPLPGTGVAHYPPVQAAEYLKARLDETYLPPDLPFRQRRGLRG